MNEEKYTDTEELLINIVSAFYAFATQHNGLCERMENDHEKTEKDETYGEGQLFVLKASMVTCARILEEFHFEYPITNQRILVSIKDIEKTIEPFKKNYRKDLQ